jgi:hypothetical protein
MAVFLAILLLFSVLDMQFILVLKHSYFPFLQYGIYHDIGLIKTKNIRFTIQSSIHPLPIHYRFGIEHYGSLTIMIFTSGISLDMIFIILLHFLTPSLAKLYLFSWITCRRLPELSFRSSAGNPSLKSIFHKFQAYSLKIQ